MKMISKFKKGKVFREMFKDVMKECKQTGDSMF